MDGSATQPLNRWERIGITLFVICLLAFGAHVEQRSAFLERRMGDLDVFLRAAWAVRNGADLYKITSDNDWHYIYPPLYAIVMTPLADPPMGENPSAYLPYPISVAICYIINLISLFLGVHVLASALEESAEGAVFPARPKYCRRWWMLRLLPILICFLPIGHTLMRGQVNVIVLASLCAAMASWLRQRKFQAGLWLALAICIKVIPVYLLVYPVWKRDGRTLLGCLAGCFAGLVLIPGLVFGPTRTVNHYETYAEVFFGPFLQLNDHDTHRDEITGVNATDSIGVKDALHNWMYTGSQKRPEDMHAVAKAVYLLLGFAMTFATLWPGARPRNGSTIGRTHQFAGLILLMTIFSPVCHSHYLLFCLPIVMSLLAQAWQYQPTIRVPRLLAICFIVFNVTMAVAYLPGLEILKDRCAALFATLPLWGIPVAQLWRGTLVPKLELGNEAIAATGQESRTAA
jgi:alpha-1,2-mannosyltransferase